MLDNRLKVVLKENVSLPDDIENKINKREIFAISCNEEKEKAYCVSGEERFFLSYDDIEEIYSVDEV